MLKNIPTNVITGFLGVGKTTVILHLLKHKPEHETWAVLVNEFGKIGIDGALMAAEGVAVKEIPGGCMCCASGVSLQVGLNALVAKARPDRLLIEPTGIGHPREIIKQLSQPPYDQLLNMEACLCVIDPRHLGDERYLEHETYQQQLSIADVWVVNKLDMASDDDRHNVEMLSQQYHPVRVDWVNHGELSPERLSIPRTRTVSRKLISLFAAPVIESVDEALQLEEGEQFRRQENRGEGRYACGWLFDANSRFDALRLVDYLRTLNAERIKALVLTSHGGGYINLVDGVGDCQELNSIETNRIEIISLTQQDWQAVEQQLLACLL